jgi:hypothetical protein
MAEIEPPNEKLLRRTEAAALAQQHFAAPLDALRDMVGYGTNLIIRAYSASDNGNVPMVVIGVLLKQIVEMLDAIDVLMSQGHSYPALLQVRAAFEASLYIDWILKVDSENRARHYIISNLRDEVMWALRTIPGTSEKTAFEAAVGRVPHADPGEIIEAAKKHLVEVRARLAKPEFQPIDVQFTKVRGKRPYDPHWYEVLGVGSVRGIAEDVGRLRDYEIIYGRGSDAMHAGLYKDHLKLGRGGFVMRPLRNLADANTVFNFAMMVAVHSFRVVLNQYRPDELAAGAFKTRYLERWQKTLWSIPEVKYKYV